MMMMIFFYIWNQWWPPPQDTFRIRPYRKNILSLFLS
jgi:hypothetical protein